MCICLLKSLFITINTIMIILGVAIVALGVTAIVLLNNFGIEGASMFAIVIIVVGVVFTAIFCFGCCGAMNKNSCLLIIYTVILVILGVLTVVVETALINVDSIKDGAAKIVTDSIESTDQGSSVLSMLEAALQCCGTTGPDYYNNSTLPISCCPSKLGNLSNIGNSISTGNIDTEVSITDQFACTIADAYTVGCVTMFADFVHYVMSIIKNVLTGICISEFVMAGIAIILTCCDRRRKA